MRACVLWCQIHKSQRDSHFDDVATLQEDSETEILNLSNITIDGLEAEFKSTRPNKRTTTDVA